MRPDPKHYAYDLAGALNTVVGLRARIPEDAFTADVLGTERLGHGVFIGEQTMIQGRFDGRCTIADHVWIGPQAYFDARDLVIEEYVGWGPGAKVLGSTHTGLPVDVPLIQTDLVIKPVRIGAGADIGMNAVILPGVSVGRGAIVDLADLTAALQSGLIAGAGLDVFETEPLPAEHPLWRMDNVILTPHVAGASPRIAERHLATLLENVRRFVAGDALFNVVDKHKWF